MGDRFRVNDGWLEYSGGYGQRSWAIFVLEIASIEQEFSGDQITVTTRSGEKFYGNGFLSDVKGMVYRARRQLSTPAQREEAAP